MPIKSAAEWFRALPVGAPATRWHAENWIRAVQADAVRWAAEQQRESDALVCEGQFNRATIRNNPLVQLPKEGE
jgi:hypothetical protein